MPIREQVTPTLSVSLDVTCPYCDHYYDLLADDDGMYSTAIFNNDWADVYGSEEECPNCNEVFIIEEIEY